MIAGMWRGWTNAENGALYERVFRTVVVPELDGVKGCKQAYLFRRELGDEVEFIALTMFELPSAVQAFAGKP
jgi:hypothetical protein